MRVCEKLVLLRANGRRENESEKKKSEKISVSNKILILVKKKKRGRRKSLKIIILSSRLRKQAKKEKIQSPTIFISYLMWNNFENLYKL